MRDATLESDQGVYRLKQAMGGGKTHNLPAAALLARNAGLRTTLLSTALASAIWPDHAKTIPGSTPWSDVELSDLAFEAGISAPPLSSYYLRKPRRQALLGYAGLRPEEIRHGIGMLAALKRWVR